MHEPVPGDEAGWLVADRFVPIAGDGAPLVGEFAVAEFAAAVGMTTDAGKVLVGQAVELAHRLPKLWSLVGAGRVPGWQARRVADKTMSLCPEAAGFVDAQVAGVVGKIGVAQLDRLVEEAKRRHMPLAGRAISKAAAETLKRVTLELGGKGANLVFADADARAVERGVRHLMNNSGQSCNAPSRMLVERSFYDRAVEIAAEVASGIKVGPASEPGKHIGPVVNQRQWDQIQGHIQTGIDEGARLVAGGLGLPEGMNKGFYVRPTIFADVTPGMTIEREEIFGPVLCMIPFDTEAEAVRIANDTPYGLTNYVQSQDGARRNRLARQLRAGMVEMNGKSRGAGAPFGGVKASGRAREGGAWGIEEFLEVKAISGWDVAAE